MIIYPTQKDTYGNSMERRIIGVEIRLIDYTGTEELALLPCDIRFPLPKYPHDSRAFSITIHTDRGDVNLQNGYFQG
jgi:hypothetical protein